MSLRKRISGDFAATAQALRRQLQGRSQAALRVLTERVGERTLRVAVTGPARAGKTVFMTALAQNLLLRQQLQFFTPAGRIRVAEIGGVGRRPQFPFERNLQALIDADSDWPASTEAVSALTLALDYQPKGFLTRRVADTLRLNIELIDYPGEWLLDLPMLTQDYEAWSADLVALCRRAPRARLAEQWLGLAEQIAPNDPLAHPLLQPAIAAFHQFLRDCRTELGLTLVQPGRVLKPGSADLRDEALMFLPLPRIEALPKAGSVHEAMARRFDAYRDRLVKPFYRDHFREFDKQLVLVDVLTALHDGKHAFEDLQLALAAIMESFRYGRNGMLAKLFGAKIDKVQFAATKADHVTANQFNNLHLLLEAMVKDKVGDIQPEGTKIDYEALASVKCTTNKVVLLDGKPLSVLRGRLLNTGEEREFYPGEIPAELPRPEDWDEQFYSFFEFAKPPLPAAKLNGFSNIHLGRALEFLVGDQFR